MKRLLKSRKALSPVVAAIILIAVTVAVSIAVAAWMGALTFTFMQTEQLEIQGASFTTGNIALQVKNTGTSDLNVAYFKLGLSGAQQDIDPDVSVAQGQSTTVNCATSWTSGTTYDIYIITSTGKQFTYRAVAP